MLNVLDFIHSDFILVKATVQQMLDTVAIKCMSASQRIFMPHKCCEWFSADLN